MTQSRRRRTRGIICDGAHFNTATIERACAQMAERPRRIQRKRTKGWRMPSNAVYVGEPSKWANPYGGIPAISAAAAVTAFRKGLLAQIGRNPLGPTNLFGVMADALSELRGKDLACWCPLDEPCHADILLEIANG